MKKDYDLARTIIGMMPVVLVLVVSLFLSSCEEKNQLTLNFNLTGEVSGVIEKSAVISDFIIEKQLSSTMKIYSLPDSFLVYNSGSTSNITIDLAEGEYFIDFEIKRNYTSASLMWVYGVDTNVYVSGYTVIDVNTDTDMGLISINTENIGNISIEGVTGNIPTFSQDDYEYVYVAKGDYTIDLDINSEIVTKLVNVKSSDALFFWKNSELSINILDFQLNETIEEL